MKSLVQLLFTTGLVAGITAFASAQQSIDLSSDSGTFGSTVDITVTLDLDGTEGITGWSIGVCHDPAIVGTIDVTSDPLLMTSGPNGGPVSFEAVFVVQNDLSIFNPAGVPQGTAPAGSSPGATQAVIVDFLQMATFPSGANSVLSIEYEVVAVVGSSVVELCETVSSPTGIPVSLSVSSTTSPSIPFDTTPGTITVLQLDPAALVLGVDVPVPAGGQAEVPVLLSNPFEDAIGYQFGVTHDPLIVTPVDAIPSPSFAGGMPAFFEFDSQPVNGDGVVVLALLSLQPPFDSIPLGFDNEICRLVYEAPSTVVDGDMSALDFSAVLQPSDVAPPSPVLIAFEGETLVPTQTSGSLVVSGTAEVSFVRGSLDASAGVGLADVIALLNILFSANPPILDCEDVADIDDSGALGLPDAILLLGFLFNNPSSPVPTPSPAAPGLCGTDPTDDTLVCDSFDAALCP